MMCLEMGASARNRVMGSVRAKLEHLSVSFSIVKASKSWDRDLLLASFDGWSLR